MQKVVLLYSRDDSIPTYKVLQDMVSSLQLTAERSSILRRLPQHLLSGLSFVTAPAWHTLQSHRTQR